ncbi:MAG TPA: Crp/Fnr family transcriptional regulator [Noviherbaspirillum sp.]|nr:Crp/Fnr family transcriptional regulator [Noviherbaspirillum sp.]
MKKEAVSWLSETSFLKRDIIANIELYRSLSHSQLDSLADTSITIRKPRGTQLVRSGELAKGVYVVVFGQVRVYCERADGSQHTLEILERGDSFGLAEIFLDRPYLVSVEVVSDALVILTPKEQIFNLTDSSSTFSRDLLHRLAQQTHTVVSEFHRKISATAKQRLASYLLHQSERQSNKDVELDTSKMLLACRLGIAAPTFSRLLQELSSAGLIEVRGRQIRILDAEKMDLLETA